MKSFRITYGMPVILNGDCPRAQNVMVVVGYDNRTRYAKVAPLHIHKIATTSEVPFDSITPLKIFGVMITANTKHCLFAALSVTGLQNRTSEVGTYRRWEPMPNVETVPYNPSIFRHITLDQMLSANETV